MGPRTHLYERLVGEPELDGPAARDAMCTRSAGGAGRGRHRALKTGGGWGWGGTPFSDPLSAQLTVIGEPWGRWFPRRRAGGEEEDEAEPSAGVVEKQEND